MTVKAFISYSHKDESYKDELKTWLSNLRRSGDIEDWNDRDINAGELWRDEIDENLNESQVIFFILSPDFLASDYCVEYEAKKAMEMHEKGISKLIPIVARPCDWLGSELSKYQGIPTDGVAISTWRNNDEAWLNATKYIKDILKELETSDHSASVSEPGPQNTDFLVPEFSLWLNDTEIELAHSKSSVVSLRDIYEYPDLEVRDYAEDSILMRDASILLTESGHHLVLGEEQSGKTSLLKNLFFDSLEVGLFPVYFDCSNVSTSNVEKVIRRSVSEQYMDTEVGFIEDAESCVVLVDNLDHINLNPKHRNILVDGILNRFGRVVICCDSYFAYASPEIPILEKCFEYEILGLGNKKREALVGRWVSLGVEEQIGDDEYYGRSDEIKSKLDAVIQKNIVPPKPVYVLMLIQIFEAYGSKSLELTSYGHCYQELIYQSFRYAGIKTQEFDKYLNFLTEISWKIFLSRGGLSDSSLKRFYKEYDEKFLKVDKDELVGGLKKCSILINKDGMLCFKYPYIYYFFVGKSIAEGYSRSGDVRFRVKELVSELNRDDYANILIFVTHHTKEVWVLEEIKSVLGDIFPDREPATLDRGQLKFMDEFIEKIPELVLEQREIQNERDAYNERKDEVEFKDEDEPLQDSDILVQINKTFRGMEVAGQIIRNRNATLPKDELYALAESGVATGLRFLDYFVYLSGAAQKEVVQVIADALYENPKIPDDEVEKQAKDAFLHLTYGVINTVLRKIAAAIGSKEAYEIYNKLADEQQTQAIALVDQAIDINFGRNLDLDKVAVTQAKIRNNPVCLRILKEMVIEHTYFFPVEYQKKQRIGDMLGVSVQGQRLMDKKSRGKQI